MSLDIMLYSQPREIKCICSCCGNEHSNIDREEVWDANITHNLAEMAQAAGVYKYIWRPDENKITHALQMIRHLVKGLKLLKKYPKKFAKYNPANSWGDYDNLIVLMEDYLRACKNYPNATIEVSR